MIVVRVVAQILIWGSLAYGVLAASTAYLVDVHNTPVDELLELTHVTPHGDPEKQKLTRASIEALQSDRNGIFILDFELSIPRYIQVSEFNWNRWPFRWDFIIGMAGILIGAVLSRVAARPRTVRISATGEPLQPSDLLTLIRQAVTELHKRIAAEKDETARLTDIVNTVGELQRTHIEAFIESYAEMKSTLGSVRAAAVMDRFAVTERQLNRAWSAATDRADGEAVACIEEAVELLGETEQAIR